MTERAEREHIYKGKVLLRRVEYCKPERDREIGDRAKGRSTERSQRDTTWRLPEKPGLSFLFDDCVTPWTKRLRMRRLSFVGRCSTRPSRARSRAKRRRKRPRSSLISGATKVSACDLAQAEEWRKTHKERDRLRRQCREASFLRLEPC